MSQKRVFQLEDKQEKDQFSHLVAGWIPINGMLTRQLLKRISAGEFDRSLDLLLNELKKDFGLITFCLRKSIELGWLSVASHPNPFDVLSNLTVDQFRKLLAVGEEEITNHSLNDMNKAQALRLKHTVISTTTAETLAPRAGVNKGLAYSSALVRQLGLNIVAWNYPRVYQKALETCNSSQENLDKQILKALGISPRNLGIRLLFPSEPPHETFLISVGVTKADGDKDGMMAARICEIGERFARASDPVFFPVETREQGDVVKEINAFLGPQGLSLLQSAIDVVGRTYATNKPLDVNIDPKENLKIANKTVASKLVANNAFLAKCPPWLKERFERVYAEITPGAPSPKALEILITDVIPESGFFKGCIFLADNSGRHLVPKLRIGPDPIERYKPISLSEASSSELSLIDAFSSNLPLKEEEVFINGELVSHVSGPFGSEEKKGLLYLEPNEHLLQGLENEPIAFFRAIRQCLNDCLALKGD